MAIDYSVEPENDGDAAKTFLGHLGEGTANKDAELLQFTERVLRIAFRYSKSALAAAGCQVRLVFNTDKDTRTSIGVRATGQAQYVVEVPMAFLWKTVRFCRPICASLSAFFSLERSIAACVLLMFFHEVAHIAWGHLERTGASPAEYRADEASADYRGGKLLAQCLFQAEGFAAEVDLVRPDDRVEYALVGGVLFGALMEAIAETISPLYHGPIARWQLMVAGFVHANEQLGAMETGRQQMVFERTQRRLALARLPQLQRMLVADSGEEPGIEDTAKILDDRVPDLLNTSPAAAGIRQVWGKFTRRVKRRGKPLTGRIPLKK